MSEEVRICRVCFTTKVNLFNIHEKGISDAFQEVSGTLAYKMDGMPSYLCGVCVHLMHKCRAYRNACQESQHILRQIGLIDELTAADLANMERANNISLCQRVTEVVTFPPITPPLKTCFIVHVDIPGKDMTNGEHNNSHDFEQIIFNDTDDVEIKRETDYDNYDLITNIKIENMNYDSDGFHDDGLPDEIVIKNDDFNRINEVIEETVQEEKSKRDLRKRKVAHKVKRENLKEDKKRKRVKKRKKVAKRTEDVKEEFDEHNDRYRIAKLFYNYNPQLKLTKENLEKRVEMLESFLKNYSVEVKFLSREEQKEEVEKRKQYYKHLPFQCGLCNRGYSVEESYKIHMTTHDPTAGDHECDICGIRCKTRQDRRKHVNAAHLKRFTCKICGKVTKSQSYAKAHFAHHGGATYTCDDCDKKFTKKASFLGHMRRVHKANAVNCPICNETFVGQFGLNLHMAMKHKQAVKCESCGLLFDSAGALSTHLGGAADGVCSPGVRACMRCGEGFPSEELLESHTRDHHTKKRINCEECDKTFVYAHSLDAHWSRAHADKPRPAPRAAPPPRPARRDAPRDHNKLSLYMCDQCGKSFHIRTHFTLHMRLHTGEKPHRCALCPKTFRLPIALKMHILTHTDERPYRCAVCPRAFRQSAHLHTHMRTHTQEKPHVCAVCGKAFSQVANMREHARTVHEGLPPRRRKRDKIHAAE